MVRRLIRLADRYARAGVRRLLTPAGVMLGAAAMLVFVWTMCGWALAESHNDASRHATENARSLMLVIERDVARNIELYDLSLQAVVEGVANPQLMALEPHLRGQVLFDRAASGRYLGTIFVMNERGDIVLDSRAIPARAGNFADRDYFTFHRDHASSGLYISKPYASRMRNGALTIALSRRLTRADGSFGGIVAGTLSIEYFRDLLDGVSVGKHGTAAIIETNGCVVARLPYDPATIGRDVSRAPIFVEAMAKSEGSFTGTASIDGIRRLYVHKRLAGLPLIVDVAPAEVDIYADWFVRARRFCLLVAAFSAIIVAGALLLARELGRRHRAEERLQYVARHDALTGLYNRGTFDERLAEESARARRSGTPLSLLFVDIDQFKAYNDYYGHQAGDEALRDVARSLSLCARRPGDNAARYGGEEFVMILPDTDAQAARAIAETIRRAIAAQQIEHIKSVFGRLSVSIGVATRVGGTFSDHALIQLADAALYKAKSQGRNRVCEGEALEPRSEAHEGPRIA